MDGKPSERRAGEPVEGAAALGDMGGSGVLSVGEDGGDFELARPEEGRGDDELREPERPVVSLVKGDAGQSDAGAAPRAVAGAASGPVVEDGSVESAPRDGAGCATETPPGSAPDAHRAVVPQSSPGVVSDARAASAPEPPLAEAPDAPPTPAPQPPSEATPDAPATPVPEPLLDAVPGGHGTPVPEPPLDAAPSAPDTPLHTPDAYSTPPYGHPGPWAPAPPVQHPGTAQGDPWARYDPWAPSPLQQTGESVPSERQRKREWRKGIVAGALLLALVSGGVGGVVGVRLERHGIGGIELPQAPPEPPGRDADSVAGIAARALPSVVTLHVKGGSESGTGTGFVLDDLGYILTNNHVVQPAGSGGDITVVFNGGQAVKAEIVGRDAGYDLAVVRVKGVRNLTPLPLGNSDGVQVGDPVVAIGAPFDLSGTVTSGIISATERPITAGGDGSDVSYVDALQTDAPINPGNSGGPLLDARGRVIGINSAIRSANGSDTGTGQSGSVGLGFAIPVNQGKRIAEELIRNGRATHPIIGITLDLAYTGDGARVRTDKSEAGPPVTVGGPGDLAGIEPGDVVTEVDGKPVHSSDELIVKVRAHRPGDELRLTVVRGGKTMSLSLVLGSAGG
ncbi:S1C family serine protease [Streptomyces acidiscabies]|uniref:Trypsin-like peptidase domain-containing protein n=1 Tax=Streptomyces acidiscabies TaxID=42234 RepID=A0AAP6B9L7_9ACTN|nr:trypsin-like peptidase domain-containing protein [Streptomyces acidiscabies]MDX2960702.1 trypsin-like peptidase domain-containing protein [Streptomyces acidiscabies]MDX3020762.1 trypsin-like peptidase domain-containing protein [Streptomyces acidiscabies]MDX3792867.1 trypsin-like peptidase domain-containing protein [Streptomyces acidiscabies]